MRSFGSDISIPVKTSFKILNFIIVILFAPIANSIVIVPKQPQVKVESYVLYNPNTGTIIASEEETNQIKPASITKLMTAYSVFHAIKEGQIAMDDPVRVSRNATVSYTHLTLPTIYSV